MPATLRYESHLAAATGDFVILMASSATWACPQRGSSPASCAWSHADGGDEGVMDEVNYFVTKYLFNYPREEVATREAPMSVPKTERFFVCLGRFADALSVSGMSAVWLLSSTADVKGPDKFGPEQLQSFCVELAVSAAARSARPGAVTIMWLTAECKEKARTYALTVKGS